MAPKRKYPSFDKLIEAADEIGILLVEEIGAVSVIAGGLAMQAYGSPRLTADVDLLSSNDPEINQIEGFAKTLSFGGVRGKASNGVEVDIIVRADAWQRMYGEALNDAADVEDLPLRVVKPEYLLVMKMVARRTKDDEDVMFLLRNEVVGLKETRQLVTEYLGQYGLDDLESLIEEAKWLNAKERK